MPVLACVNDTVLPEPPLPPLPPGVDDAGGTATTRGGGQSESPSASEPSSLAPAVPASIAPDREPDLQATPPPATGASPSMATPTAPAPSASTERATASAPIARPAPTGPQSTLRITEIPAPDPMAWVTALDRELAQCAELGFFERPECAWAARKQYCEPNQGWGKVKECPAQP